MTVTDLLVLDASQSLAAPLCRLICAEPRDGVHARLLAASSLKLTDSDAHVVTPCSLSESSPERCPHVNATCLPVCAASEGPWDTQSLGCTSLRHVAILPSDSDAVHFATGMRGGDPLLPVDPVTAWLSQIEQGDATRVCVQGLGGDGARATTRHRDPDRDPGNVACRFDDDEDKRVRRQRETGVPVIQCSNWNDDGAMTIQEVASACWSIERPHRAETGADLNPGTLERTDYEAHGIGMLVKALVQQNTGASLFIRMIMCVAALLCCVHSILVEGPFFISRRQILI